VPVATLPSPVRERQPALTGRQASWRQIHAGCRGRISDQYQAFATSWRCPDGAGRAERLVATAPAGASAVPTLHHRWRSVPAGCTQGSANSALTNHGWRRPGSPTTWPPCARGPSWTSRTSPCFPREITMAAHVAEIPAGRLRGWQARGTRFRLPRGTAVKRMPGRPGAGRQTSLRFVQYRHECEMSAFEASGTP